MKILCINSKPNFDFFTKRGLNLDVSYGVTYQKFEPIKVGVAIDANGNSVNTYSPDVFKYLDNLYRNEKYDAIFFGWKPEDYPSSFAYTGGQTFRQKLSNGAYFATTRQDGNNYEPHELMHIIGQILYIDLKKYDAVDQMDSIVKPDGTVLRYYKNDRPDDPDSNWSVTWETYKKYLPELNALNNMPIVIITRNKSTKNQTTGNLSVSVGTTKFSCKTMELPWLENKRNVSCIPTGTYLVKWTLSPRMMKYTYEVQKVPNRSGIRIHAGNFYKDFLGCIGLGASFADINKDGEIDITSSRNTVKAFEALMGKKDFTLVIK